MSVDFDNIPVLDLEDVERRDLRVCKVEYGEWGFPVEYDAEKVATPAFIIAVQHMQKWSAHSEEAQNAREKLERRAAQFNGSLNKDAAFEKACRIMPDVAARLEPEEPFDFGVSSELLSKVVVRIGLRGADGRLYPPTFEFFKDRHFDFHAAVIGAINEDYARPTNASTETPQDTSSQTANSGISLIDTDASPQPNGSEVSPTGEISTTI